MWNDGNPKKTLSVFAYGPVRDRAFKRVGKDWDLSWAERKK